MPEDQILQKSASSDVMMSTQMPRKAGFTTRRQTVALGSRRITDAICAFLLATLLAAFLLPECGYGEDPFPGALTFGLGGSEQEVTESFDGLLPLYAPKSGLLFFNPRFTTSDALDPR